jgi:hypothetical protein
MWHKNNFFSFSTSLWINFVFLASFKDQFVWLSDFFLLLVCEVLSNFSLLDGKVFFFCLLVGIFFRMMSVGGIQVFFGFSEIRLFKVFNIFSCYLDYQWLPTLKNNLYTNFVSFNPLWVMWRDLWVLESKPSEFFGPYFV